MKLAVFNDYRVGVVVGDEVVDVSAVLPELFERWPIQRINWLIEHWDELGPQVRAAAEDHAQAHRVADVTLRAASPAPRQLFALPANFHKHLTELGTRSVSKGRTAREQGFFLKSAGSVIGAGEEIVLPHGSARRFDHECELAVVIGKSGRDVPRADAMDLVFGFSTLIDLTMRIEPGEFEEERSMRKSFESFTPVGPYLVTAAEVGPLEGLVSRLSVNGELRQRAPLRDLIVDVPEAIELITSVVPVFPGDVIAMGTPQGVGPVGPGDSVTIGIDDVGQMTLPVRARAAASPRPY
ncbi:fumarylacetoacetate hydrolase family protein [Actinacidiphila sp. ITFR-21]|uniref:fumarylacetoacetate hydrolase family protein n=1 Tax=Actinacidiphila sp. ITFR-21 TaxID=3075199 RepID=UPI00288B32FE|nr:fumarylacetoacetate hydrolase family protein [Streptomyces sp. ITFR-21]WNI18755.1 fumarylacetoacetate hydrolase family protein [Streptomyces sp. ITFR-21]